MRFFLTAFCIIVGFAASSQISGGLISVDFDSVTEWFDCPGEVRPIYNRTPPSGGSGVYVYSWEYKIGSGGTWLPYTGSSNTNQTHPITDYFYHYRRKAKDANNLNDSAYSDVVWVSSITVQDPGETYFEGNYIACKVKIGDMPLSIINYRGADLHPNGTPFIQWQKSNNITGPWIDIPGATGYTYQPPVPTDTIPVYYQRLAYTCFGDVQTPAHYVFVIPSSSNLFFAGTISASLDSACGNTPISFFEVAPASGHTNPLKYQWQYSTDSVSWTNLDTNLTYTETNLSQTKYYRRRAQSLFSIAYSNTIKIVYKSGNGNPSLFGNNKWNIHCYNGKNVSLSSISYSGLYIRDSAWINTNLDWSTTASPSLASGYQGCPISVDNFTISAKRQGFDTGTYIMQIPINSGDIQVYRNGSLIYSTFTINANPASINVGKLGASAKLEIRQACGTGDGALQMNLIKIAPFRIASWSNSNCNNYNRASAIANNWIDLVDSSGAMIASVFTNTNNLGTLSASKKHFQPGSNNVPANVIGNKYLPRYFNFNSSTFGDGNFATWVTVRLYFLNSEFDEYRTATNQPNLMINDLMMSHYDGNNEDCDITNNSIAGTNLPAVTGTVGTDGFYIETYVNSFSEFGVSGGTHLLPVNWLSANATRQKNFIKVEWKVANQINNDRFEVMRSTDGFTFSTVGIVAGKNSSAPVTYSFNDHNIGAGKYFYRIKQVDKDGKYSLSSVITASYGKETGFIISPNPVTSALQFTIAEPMQSFVITDISGRTIIQRSNISAGLVSINVSNLQAGMYLLKSKNISGEERTSKFNKQ